MRKVSLKTALWGPGNLLQGFRTDEYYQGDVKEAHTSTGNEFSWYNPQITIATGFTFVESFSSKVRPALVDSVEVSPIYKRKQPIAPKPPRLTKVPAFRFSEPVLKLVTVGDFAPPLTPRALSFLRERIEDINRHRIEVYNGKLKRFEQSKVKYRNLVQDIKLKNQKRLQRCYKYQQNYLRALEKYNLSKGSPVVRTGKMLDAPFNPYSKLIVYSSDNEPLTLELYKLEMPWTQLHHPDGSPVLGEHGGTIASMIETRWWQNYTTPDFISRFSDKDQANPVEGYRVLFEPEIAKIRPKLIEKYYDRLGDQQVHFGNMLAEQKQTVEMLTSIYTAIVKLVMAKRQALSLIYKTLTDPKAVANLVLQLQFGLKPLVADAQTLIQNISEQKTWSHQIIVKKTVASQIVRSDLVPFEGRLTCGYTSKYDLVDDNLRKANQWGLKDITQVLWEVTPWSFIVDWLIPVGNFIAACQADSGLTWREGCFSWKFVGKQFKTHLPVSGWNSATYVSGDCNVYIKGREVLLQAPSELGMLRIKNPLTTNHAIDALALLVQGLRS